MERQTITVDIAPGNNQIQRLKSSQGDIGRPLGVYITQNGVALDCSAYTADLYILKPDGNYFTATVTVDATEHNLITWETAKQETPVAGDCAAQIRILSNGDDVGTARFVEYVEASPGFVGESSESVVESLMEYVRQAATSAETASGAASSASGSASAASGSASSAASSASAAAGSASTAHTDAETASQAAQTAQDVAASIPEDYSTLSEDVTGLKSALNGSVKNLDEGKLKIADTFVFGTLDTNGDIISFANNSRCSSVEYYTASDGDVITLDTGFSMILCEYDANKSLVDRGVKVAGDYTLTSGNLYRVTIFDPNGIEQSTPYEYAFKAHLKSNIEKAFNELTADIQETNEKFNSVSDNMVIGVVDQEIVYHNDGYVNASTNVISSIGTSAQYFYSDLIPLNKGDVVTVNYRDTLDVVWILSQWTSTGTFVSGILKGNDVSDIVQAYQFTTSEDMYIRHSARFLNSLSIKRINAENADMLANYLSSENDTDYGFLLNSFLKIGGIGDSLASGECISGTQGGVTVANDLYEHSWLQYMARFYGFTGINFSKGGMTARGWLFDDDYNHQGWTKAQIADNKCNAYIIGLGANDMSLMIEDASYLGSPSDIGTTNPTFYRYYAQIISRLKTIQPKAKFFLFTLTWLYTETPPYDAWVDRVNEAIRYIGEHNENCYVIDLDADRWYYGTDVTGNRRSGHYNAIGYNMQAMHLAKLIGKYIHDHQSEFRQVEFIGTDLSWN